MSKKLLIAGEVPVTADNPLGIGELDLGLLEKMPMARYFQFRNRIVNARSQTYFDTIRLESGTNWTNAQAVRMFTVGKDQSGTIANTGTAITKSRFDTNMRSNGEFPFGVHFIVEAIEVMLDLNARLATTDTSGLVSNPAPAAKNAATYSASLLHRTLTHQTYLTFYRGDRSEEEGLLYQFPSRFVTFGTLGGDTEEGWVQNASPNGSYLDFPKVLEPDEDFNIYVEPLAATVALPNDVAIQVALIGKRIGEV